MEACQSKEFDIQNKALTHVFLSRRDLLVFEAKLSH